MAHGTTRGPVVSAIMAVHDAEGLVRRAIESLQNQTFREFELIVVDAGSSDGSARIIDSLAERDLRIDVVHTGECTRQEALDRALDRASGRYLTVIDADGCARPTMLADFVELAERRSLELVVGGIDLCLIGSNGRPLEMELSSEEQIFPTQHDFRTAAWQLFSSGQLLPAGGKLFSLRRVHDEGLRFSVGGVLDHLFVTGFLSDVERVGVLDGTCYRVDRYIAPMERMAASPRAFHLLEEEHAALLDLYRHWGLEGDVASMEMLQSRFMERLVACVESVCSSDSLPPAEQRRAVEAMIGTDQARLAASVAHPASGSARSMQAPVRNHNVRLVCAQARLLSLLERGRGPRTAPDAFV